MIGVHAFEEALGKHVQNVRGGIMELCDLRDSTTTLPRPWRAFIISQDDTIGHDSIQSLERGM